MVTKSKFLNASYVTMVTINDYLILIVQTVILLVAMETKSIFYIASYVTMVTDEKCILCVVRKSEAYWDIIQIHFKLWSNFQIVFVNGNILNIYGKI